MREWSQVGRVLWQDGEGPMPTRMLAGRCSQPTTQDRAVVRRHPVLVDNITDSCRRFLRFVETEMAGLGRRRGGAWVLGGGCLCCAAHGLSCLLTLRSGSRTHAVLFDTGPEDSVFERNVSRLGWISGRSRRWC